MAPACPTSRAAHTHYSPHLYKPVPLAVKLSVVARGAGDDTAHRKASMARGARDGAGVSDLEVDVAGGVLPAEDDRRPLAPVARRDLARVLPRRGRQPPFSMVKRALVTVCNSK
jgi:hypothetical protein